MIRTDRLIPPFLLALLALTTASPALPTGFVTPGPPVQKLRVRDALTGIALPGARAISMGAEKTFTTAGTTDEFGRLRLFPATRAERIDFAADGYLPMTIAPSFDATRTTIVWLMPADRPEALRAEMIAARRLPNTALLHGHVVSAETGRPVTGATVSLARTAIRTVTNGEGYFLVHAKAVGVVSPETVPDFSDLVISAPGYISVRLAHIALVEEDFHYVIDLQPGGGETVRDMSHRLYPVGFMPGSGGNETVERYHGKSPSSNVEPPGVAAERLAELVAGAAAPRPSELLIGEATWGGLQVANPPDQINVSGYGWFPLELYVANGLCGEWLASWDDDSLAAGAIAYRSYGAWFQAHQGFICATTTCQVFTNTHSSRCELAAQRTAGILLHKGGAVARAEYSAENNSRRCASYRCVNADPSCGDGNAGSPAGGWPCLADSHLFDQGTGRCCFGHGRGMCQWGSQAWARSAKPWNWIADHYYNDLGSGSGNRAVFLTTPFEIAVAGAPAAVGRGGTFSITETMRSYSDASQPQILLGAALIGPAVLTDPAHDKKITLLGRNGLAAQFRDSAVSRLFTVPAAALPGTYDLLVAIWLDTNGNNVIDSQDKVLRTLRYSGVLAVN